MKNYSHIQTLQDLKEFGKSESYTIPNSSYLSQSDKYVILENLAYDKYDSLLMAGSMVKTYTDEEIIKYRYKPEILSTDLYGTPNLAHLILYLNRTNEMEFNSNTIRILSPNLLDILFKKIMANESIFLNKNNSNIVG